MDSLLTLSTSRRVPTEPVARRQCIHCQNLVPDRLDSDFCCSGCETVHGILKARGLDQEYARLLSTSRSAGRPVGSLSSSPGPSDTYAYLNDPEFLRIFAEDGGQSLCFFLEGVHCAACVWLVEKLPEFAPEVESAFLNLGSGVATVRLRKPGGFADAADKIRRLGYAPHPVKDGATHTAQLRDDRTALIRMGVAAAASANIMLLAISLYSGLQGGLAMIFRWLSFALFLPVLTYSAIPFYKSAFSALRTRMISIDIPIVLGLILGFGASLYNLITGSEHIYFDSLAALIFLLLASRYVLRKAQQRALTQAGLLHFLTPSLARKVDADTRQTQDARIETLHPGDLIEVRVGESVPVDGNIKQGESMLDCALLSGEAAWVPAGPGDPVFAGTTNQGAPLWITVVASGAQTRLGKILKSAESGLSTRTPMVLLTDRVSQFFVSGVLILSILGFALGWIEGGFSAGLNRALAMLIVTCPCALALATPLTVANSMGRAARLGILIRNSDVLEKMARVREIFFDKTGTLTQGSFSVLRWNELDGDPAAHRSAVLALESRSRHPIAQALVRSLGASPTSVAEVSQFREILGGGVEGVVTGRHYRIGRLPDSETTATAGTWIEVVQDNKRVATILLGDTVRPESPEVIQSLENLGIASRILTGDHASAALQVGNAVGVTPDRITAALTPEQKRLRVLESPESAMVGDGANDAPALSAARVGVSVQGGMEVSLRTSDVYTQRPGLKSVVDLALISRETVHVLWRNIAFSVFYNVLGVAATLAGAVGPLFAAVLMPASAATVFFSSIVGTRRLRAMEHRK